ncbi:MAG: hypothetical protein OWU32_03485 [Firmicutes bacterium]|nr:hypothetical protein [Bacillota bacterium]
MTKKKPWGLTRMVVIAAAMLGAGLFIHPVTALGEDLGENELTGWRGVYETGDQQYFVEFDYDGTADVMIPVHKMPAGWFVQRGENDWMTPMDDLRVLRWYAAADPGNLKSLLGTSGNVASLSVIFPSGAVGYTQVFLKALTRLHVNPETFGGPDIPPGSVPLAMLDGGVLHVDTLSNDNTLSQCEPGQMPAQLQWLLGRSRAGK